MSLSLTKYYLSCFERIHRKITHATLKSSNGIAADTFLYDIKTWIKPLDIEVNLNNI
jgi:hypothetical protein